MPRAGRALTVVLVVAMLALPYAACAQRAADQAQAAAEPVNPKEHIPEGPLAPIRKGTYQSWSIFVICNPSWLQSQSREKVEDLYTQFLAYGNAIGPDHVAVWFWSVKPGLSKHGELDVERNANFCARLKLPPSKSPYLIFTTHYPGKALSALYPDTFPTVSELENHYVLSLNGISAASTTRILSSLADNLVLGKINAIKVDSSEYWSAWQTAYEAVRDEITGLVGRVTVTFDTGFVKTEVKLSK